MLQSVPKVMRGLSIQLRRLSSGLSPVTGGLTLRPGVAYPAEVARLVELVGQSPVAVRLAASLQRLDAPRKGALLVRRFALNDDLGNAFLAVHALKLAGVPVEREAYRHLMFACCKYADVDLGLFAMELMLADGRPDFASFKRLFDVCASQVDLRLWVAYDVLRYWYPLRGFPERALATTAYITELMDTLGLGPSKRAGRGFITLPNPRGEPFDPFRGLFDADDPNWPELDDGALERLQLIPLEYEDRNNMARIVARQRRRREDGAEDEGQHLAVLDAAGWSDAALANVVEAERTSEAANLEKVRVQLEIRREFDSRPTPSLGAALLQKWREKQAERKRMRD